MPGKKQSIDYVIQTVCKKMEEAEGAFNKLYRNPNLKQKRRFITLCMLDTFLTKFTPGQLAEYQNERTNARTIRVGNGSSSRI